MDLNVHSAKTRLRDLPEKYFDSNKENVLLLLVHLWLFAPSSSICACVCIRVCMHVCGWVHVFLCVCVSLSQCGGLKG